MAQRARRISRELRAHYLQGVYMLMMATHGCLCELGEGLAEARHAIASLSAKVSAVCPSFRPRDRR